MAGFAAADDEITHCRVPGQLGGPAGFTARTTVSPTAAGPEGMQRPRTATKPCWPCQGPCPCQRPRLMT